MAAKDDGYGRPLVATDELDAAVPAGGVDRTEPNASSRVPWYRSLPLLVRGDIDAFIVVFGNNLASVLIAVGLIEGKIGRGRCYDYVVPGIALSMLFGCVFYGVQAQFKSASTGRQNLCAQPFGINTPGIFAFVFSIIYPVYAGAGGGASTHGPTEEAAQKLAWRVGVLANFVQGCIEIILSVIGPRIATAVPIVALLGSLASIGLTFLFTNAFQGEVFAPVVGFLPFYIILMAIYSNVKLPKIPAMLFPVALGAAAAWIMRRPEIASVEVVKQNVELLGWHPPLPTFEAFENLGKVAKYLPVVFPVALTVSMGTIQCREVAAKAGDPYNLRASMLGDGLATVVAALFGSPFGMTVFIGHPGFKMMGAKVGYNFLCGLGFVVTCFSGMAGLFKAIFPTQSLNPVLLFIGLAICSDALEVTPPRHWPALMLALVPCFCNWATTQATNFAVGICAKEPKGCQLNPNSPGAWTVDVTGDLRGLYALGQGYLLTSIYLSAMLIYVVDRAFAKAALWAFVSALSASVGLIHADMLFLPWEGPSRPSGIYNADQFDLHWDFVVAYLLLAGLFLFCALLQSRGIIPRGPVKLVGAAEEARNSFFEEGGLLPEREQV